MIFGDNLQVMKSLLEMKRSGELCSADGVPGVRLIYIDPPFASKQEYHGAAGERAYADKVAGAGYLAFLRKRLIFMRQLLRDDGGISVHRACKRQAHMRVLMHEFFSEPGFRNEHDCCYSNKMPAAPEALSPTATDPTFA